MTPGRMHADVFEIDVALVRRLMAAQFPQWVDLPLAVVAYRWPSRRRWA